MGLRQQAAQLGRQIDDRIARLNGARRLRPPRILVADDDPAVVAIMREAIEEVGGVIATHHRTLAIDLLRTVPFDAIVCDLSIDLCAAAREVQPDAPLLIISGSESVAAEARRFGASAWRRKPVDLDDLIIAVRELIAR